MTRDPQMGDYWTDGSRLLQVVRRIATPSGKPRFMVEDAATGQEMTMTEHEFEDMEFLRVALHDG